MRRFLAALVDRACLPGLAALTLVLTGCGRTPTPLAPQISGSIGMPHRGVLTNAAELPPQGVGYKWLRQDDRHYGIPRFVGVIERAAAKVAAERPGAMLAVGDLSTRHGGQLLPHFSHRNGRDADLLFYMTTLDGVPVESPGFVHVGHDGLAWDDAGKRFLRFDVERTWLLVKSLLEDPDAHVQWLFANRNVRAMLLEWARARGDSPETILRAMQVMGQPNPGGPHDDHIHIRTACTPREMVSGCEASGPLRSWVMALDAQFSREPPPDAPVLDRDDELVLELLRPLDETAQSNASASR